MKTMKKKFVGLLCLVLCLTCLAACIKGGSNPPNADEITVYCSQEYSASFGNYGFFAVTVMEEEVELETTFDDLSGLQLGGAFSGMRIDRAQYNETDHQIEFCVIGELASGKYGTVEGEGIVKGLSVKVNVPISEAFASANGVLYESVEQQKIELELLGACFNKDITAADFVLRGAMRNMTVTAVSTDHAVDDDGEEVLSQTAILTVSGLADGTDYAYIEISDAATTYNQPLQVVVNTEHRGAVVTNEYIDTFALSDVIYVEAKNLTFSETVTVEDVTLGGILQDYAVLRSVDVVNDSMLALHLSFPHTFVGGEDPMGYITLDADTNDAQLEIVCSAVVAAPTLEYSIEIDGKQVFMELTLEHAEFNLMDMYPFTLYYSDGEEILVTDLEIVDIDEYLSISFALPSDCEGLLYFELEDAYDVVAPNGSTESVTVKTYFHV